MIKDMISQVYRYNAWANNRILDAAAKLSKGNTGLIPILPLAACTIRWYTS
jgi:hypothetical protein